MSVHSQDEVHGSAAVATMRSGGPAAVPADAAGRLLGRLTVLPALLALSFLLAAFPMLLIGFFKPAPVIIASVLAAAVIVPLGLRLIPSVAISSAAPRTPWWTAGALLAVALAFGVEQAIYHSQYIMVFRDPASYVQFAAWLSGHGSLPIPQNAAAFGGAASDVSFGSSAFFQVGGSIVPQFMAGLPMLLAMGFWVHGVTAALFIAPLLGAAAVLTFGGLAARLIGSRWAPLAALALALSLPQQLTSRSTFSEPLAQILCLGGLCLAVDALRAPQAGPRPRTGTQVLAALAGLALGITLLVRLDGASDTLLLIPFCGMLFLNRRPQAVPLIVGFCAGSLYGVIDGLVFSRPYLVLNGASVRPLVFAVFGVTAVTVLAVMLLWHRGGLPRPRGRWLADAVTVLPLVVIASFAVRPYVQKAEIVKLEYAPISLHWVFWYIGLPAVVFAVAAAALLARQCVLGQSPDWVLPFTTFAWTIVEGLYRPAISPDQPWASRRLVPAILPGFILLAVWAVSWLTGKLRQLGYQGAPSAALAVCCAAALLVPPVLTAYRPGLGGAGSRATGLVLRGVAVETTYSGEVAAVRGMCADIPSDATVVLLDKRLADKIEEVVRGMCGVPAAGLRRPTIATVDAVIRGIERAGRRPVLLAARQQQLSPYSLYTVRNIMTLNTTMDQQVHWEPPRSTAPLRITVWMGEVAP